MYNEAKRPIYRFRLDNGVDVKTVTPNYEDSLSIRTKLEEDEYYYRDSITSALTFLRDDIANINDVDFGTKFMITLEEDRGEGFNTIWSGEFTKVDCDFDENRHGRKIEVLPDTVDQYKLFQSGLDKEFDLIELGVNARTINYVRQPLLQVYMLGSNFVTNFVSGMSWEQDVEDNTIGSFVLEDEYSFANETIIDANGDQGNKLFVTGVGNITPDVSGDYDFPEYENATYKYRKAQLYFGPGTIIVEIAKNHPIDDFDDFGSSWLDNNNKQYEFFGVAESGNPNYNWAYFKGELPLGATPDNGTLTHLQGATNIVDIPYTNVERIIEVIVNTSQFTENDNPKYRFRRYGIYRRSDNFCEYLTETYIESFGNNSFSTTGYLTQTEVSRSRILYSRTTASRCRLIWGSYFCRIFSDLETVENEPTQNIPTGEAIPAPSTYTRVSPFAFDKFVIQDDQSVSGRLGKFDEDAANFAGEFFGEGNGNYINTIGYPDLQYLPINRREWKDAAHFLVFTPRIWDIMNAGNTDVVLRHAYSFHNVFQLLLKAVDERLIFEPTPEHSEFLYSGTNPVANEEQPNLWFTPKSNIIQGNYDKPASKAIIKLSDILKTWKVVYKGGMHITKDFKVRLEHSSWYEKGGSYTADIIGDDLIGRVNPRNKRRSDYGQDNFTFDQSDIPQQIKTTWMDFCSEAFNGRPIDIISEYAEDGNILDLSTGVVSTDLDFAQTQPNNMQREGWFMLATFTQPDGTERVPFKDVNLGVNQNYVLQNGHLSFAYLHDKFYRDAMPAEALKINGVEVTANSVKRNKIQNLEYGELGDSDPMELIATKLGNSKLQERTKNITTLQTTSIVKHGQ